MTKAKKNNIKKAVGLLVLLALVSTFSITGSLAKYVTTGGALNAVGTVAKFDVGYNFATFDLFSTVNEEDTTTAETHVSAGKIAPGTGGSFTMGFVDNSEVTVKGEFTISETNASNIPIEYSVDGGGTWKSAATIGTITINPLSSASTQTIQWRWVFEGGQDAADTALGVAAITTAPTITVTLSGTFTQVD